MRVVYLMDPLCGWCWGNSAGITTIWNECRERVPFDLLPGGMWAGPNARRQTAKVVRFIREHDPQVSRLTGASFGAAYLASLDKEDRLLDSEPPSRAIVTVRSRWPAQLFPFARAVQAARFEKGLDLNDAGTYDPICRELGLDPAAFQSAWMSDDARRQTQLAFAEAGRYAAGYPTLILLTDNEAHLLAQGYTPADQLRHRLAQVLRDAPSRS